MQSEKEPNSGAGSGKQAYKNNLAQLILRALYWVEDGMHTNYHRRGGVQLTHAQSLVMMNIGEGIRRPSAIAERLGVSRQAVHTSIRELDRLGLIDLVPDPDDGRATIATLNRKGEPARVLAIQVLEELEEELGRRIGKREVGQFRRALEKDWGAPPEFPLEDDSSKR
ncbi:MarR family winged helix-turn-helix transcriptional regulator [Parahaliea mediterranea]|uniref:MarR family winged helix-turn-helix transcriptional regulator n=1 Tax=Parahaliea mediterranea TaxID=651086 RepID=UPI000E2F106A|nr:helix-turn-helix domain-containing protein [Parahaliea mediterranea]